ncbi:cytochrome c [Croceicoccus sediminis]|uniref:cytochrome c n=1 Tax=Croceicoccus sediminis TaxID=2571150 RepID=UPI00118281DB|nr:cytochrome c [Croceicoccus sediminis]
MSFARLSAILTAGLLSACTYAGNEAPLQSPAIAAAGSEEAKVARGLAFVDARCSSCHAVRPGAAPPNPQAPSFVAVANEMDFDQDTLREFLTDGHDLPFAMTILLEEDEADIAAAYIMSLRSAR